MPKLSAKSADALYWAMLCHKTGHEHSERGMAAYQANDMERGNEECDTASRWYGYRDESLIKAIGMTHKELGELAKKTWPKNS